MIKMIAAVSQNMVIGKNNTLPWSKHYSEDLKHFKQMTANCNIIMGRNTFESIGSKPLPNRRNIVISSKQLEIESYPSLLEAIESLKGSPLEDTWLIGGSSIYKEGMKYAQEIHLTRIPEHIDGDNLVYFPEIESKFKLFFKYQISENLFKDVLRCSDQ